MTPPILPEIYHAAVSPVRFTDPSSESVFTFRYGNEMHMIRHEAVRPDFHSALATPFRHEVNIGIVVIITEEGWQTTIPTLRHMVGNACCYYTSDTGHVLNLIE
jgi:hypothetical protein